MMEGDKILDWMEGVPAGGGAVEAAGAGGLVAVGVETAGHTLMPGSGTMFVASLVIVILARAVEGP